jgi:hypothetical protein
MAHAKVGSESRALNIEYADLLARSVMGLL